MAMHAAHRGSILPAGGLLLVLVCLIGCGPALYTRPLVAPSEADTDPDLVGVYRMLDTTGKAEADKVIMLIGRDKGKEPRYRFVFLTDDKVEDSRYDLKMTAWLLAEDGVRGLVARIDGDDGDDGDEGEGADGDQKATRYYNLLYAYDDGRLTLSFIKEAVLRAEIEAGRLAGTITSTADDDPNPRDSILIEADTPDLIALFAGVGEDDLIPVFSAEKLAAGASPHP